MYITIYKTSDEECMYMYICTYTHCIHVHVYSIRTYKISDEECMYMYIYT